MYYTLVLASTALLTFEFALSKKYQALAGTHFTAGLQFNALNGLATALIFFCLSGFRVAFSPFSVGLAFAIGVLGMSYSIVGLRILKDGGMAVYSIFLMSGGMLLPYGFGVLFLEEKVSIFRIAGVAVICLAVILSNKAQWKFKASLLLPCCAIFLLNGGVSILSKCHQIGTAYAPVSSTAFVMYTGIAKCLLSSAALLFCKKEPGSGAPGRVIPVVTGAAFISGVSYMLQLVGAKELPATVLYPMVTGGSIIFSALSGKVFFKEKLSAYQLVSVILCFIGTLLFL